MNGLILAVLLFPVHGVVLGNAPGGNLIVRNDPVTNMVPAQIRQYRLEPRIHADAGVGIDAYLDTSTIPWTLRQPAIALPFTPGIPDRSLVTPVDDGSMLPNTELVTQDGTRVHLRDAFAGKTLLLSFMFTRCPDETLCPEISGKFAYLQAHLDPKSFALAEISLDPQYDSLAVLRAYGTRYGANPAMWTFLTGKGSIVQHALNEFGINSLRVSSDNFIHNDKLFIVSPQGRVASVVETAGWDPESVIAEARAVDGLSSNPFERFKLSLVASVVALCGGSQFVGIVLLELALFAIIALIAVAGLWGVARILWRNS